MNARLAFALSVSGLLLGLVSVLLSNKVFAVGVWGQSEPVVIAVHFAAGLCWLGLALERDGAMVRSALVLPGLALAGWSIVCAAFAEMPALALLGPPQSGEGALWYVDLAAFTMAAWRLRDRHPSVFDRLVMIGAGVVLVVGLGNLLRLRGVGTFFGFPEFLGYSALALLPAAHDMRRRGNRLWGVVAALGIVGLLLSRNRTAILGLGLFAVLLPRRLVVPSWLVVAVTAVIGLAPYLLLRHVDWFHGVFSLWSRSILLAVVDTHILESVKSSLFGHGWGHFQEYLGRHVADTGISLVDGRWKDLHRDEFHSHNALIEAAFAAGLPGMGLAVMLRAGIALGAEGGARRMAVAFALALSLTDATWFMMPLSLAPLGIALAALAPRAAVGGGGIAQGAAKLAAALFSLAAALVLLTNALDNQRFMACLLGASCPEVAIPLDPRGQNLDLAVMINRAMKERAERAGDLSSKETAFMAATVRQAAMRSRAGRSVLLPVAVVNAYGQSAFAGAKAPLGPMDAESEALWREEIVKLVTLAPNRMDEAVAYLNWLIREDRDRPSDTLLPSLERINPNHPVVLWFRGLRLLNEPIAIRRSEGVTMLRRAVGAGVGRFVPITREMEESMRGAQ